MVVLILTVKAQYECETILEVTMNGDETHLQGVAEQLEGETLTWIDIASNGKVFIADSTKAPKHVYTITEWEVIDLTP